jgi:hypothetical protein
MQASQGFELRPRTIGEVLDLSFRIFRRRLKTFAAIGIIFSLVGGIMAVATQVLMGPLEDGMTHEDPMLALGTVAAVWGMMLVMGLVSVAAYGVNAVAITAAAEDALRGRSGTVGDALRKSIGRAAWAMLTAVLFWFCVTLGAMACFVPAIPISIMFALAVPLVYLEHKRPLAAMGRSYQLVFDRGPRELSVDSNWVRVLIVGVITLVLMYVISIVAQLPILIVSAGSAAGRGFSFGYAPDVPLHVLLPLQLLASLVQGTFSAVGIIPWTVTYYDIRTRHEGLDLELQAEQLAAAAAGTAGGE